MTSKLTREEMQAIISALRLTPTSTVNGISLGRLADALSENEAAMDSEPVMYCMEGNGLDPEAVSTRREVVEAWVNEWNTEDRSPGEPIYSTVPLYRHAQQPVVPDVPFDGHSPYDTPYKMPSNFRELIAEEIGVLFSDDDAQSVWNVCRAAMLQAGNSPVIPDSWIPVSERMPEEGQHIIIFCDGAFVLSAQCRDGEFFDVVRDGEEFFETVSRCVTHWQPMPAAPQEVVIANRPG